MYISSFCQLPLVLVLLLMVTHDLLTSFYVFLFFSPCGERRDLDETALLSEDVLLIGTASLDKDSPLDGSLLLMGNALLTRAVSTDRSSSFDEDSTLGGDSPFGVSSWPM